MKQKIFFMRLLLVINFIHILLAQSITLKPIQKQGEEIAIIILPGALLSNNQYNLLAKEIQRQITTHQVWISLPSVFLEVPFSIAAYKAVYDALADLKANGFKEGSKIYLAGHSLGGVSAAEYAYEEISKFEGLILMGATLPRTSRSKKRTTKVLTIGGELDGLMRITRVTEELYHNCYNRTTSQEILNESPVIIIKGMNHIQFADGVPSYFVNKNDLKAEITLESAHSQIASIINAFVTNNSDYVSIKLKETLGLIMPIIEAYELEGSVHFNRPDQTTCRRGYCGKGSDWTKIAQSIISGMDILSKEGYILNVENDFVELDSLPPFKDIHHPKIIVDPIKYPKQINMTTFSQNNWVIMDRWFDGGFDYTSSNEIGSKLVSRQCSYVKGANRTKEEVPFSVDTDYNLCAEVNDAAMKWAFKRIGKLTLKRYNNVGQKYKMVNDTICNNGFSFSYTLLQFNENKTTGDIDVSSIAMMFSIDSPPIPIFAPPPEGTACLHYCKFLSPARVIEWIYVDSLRKNYGLSK